MPLPILIVLVVVGIAGIAVLTHVLGLSRARRFDSVEAARAAWLREFPETPVLDVTLCQSGQAALVQTPQGPGLVWAMGADSTARLLDGATVQAEPTALSLTLPDFGAPHVRVALSGDEIDLWAKRIGPS